MLAKPRIASVASRAKVSSTAPKLGAPSLRVRKIGTTVSNKSTLLPKVLLSTTPIVKNWGNNVARSQSFRRFSDAKTETPVEEVKANEGKPENAVEEEKKEEYKVPEIKEKAVGETDTHEFQAETRKLLDIVARSLYTDKEVFVRELVSNASDALEKLRHRMLTNENVADKDVPLEINIYADNDKKTLIIQDSGIGMEKNELVKNLGSIGFSGSLEYIKNAKDKDISSIIGQFGVGFYSSFMVANKVTVYSKSANPESKGHCWIYDGSGNYKIAEAEGVQRGTKIIIELNRDSEQFSVKDIVEKIIKKYSNFVGFPIKLNGGQVNTLKPLWTMSKSEVTEQDHKEFYQFIAHASDLPTYYLHYSTDSPINIRALFYVPGMNNERFGLPKQEGGISLFCRKVLIQSKAKGLLPDWLRFVKGVVDSEDIPLNLSREHLQDSALISKLSNVLSKKILKWLDEESHKDPEKYAKFWNEFGDFIREGVFTEVAHKEDVAKLLRFESSKQEAGKLCTLEEYISRMDKDQKDIFYAVTPNRTILENSPYYEPFRAKGIEVLVSHNIRFDEYVMSALIDYKGKNIVNIESNKAAEFLKTSKDKDDDKPRLAGEELKEFTRWMKDALAGKVSSIKESSRLVDSPALILDHENAAFRRMMQMIDPHKMPELPKQQLEVNPKHEVILKLNKLRATKPNLAKLAAEQIFDDALVAAGLMPDARSMLPRLNTLISTALDTASNDIEPPKEPTPKEEKKEEKEKKPKRETKKKTKEDKEKAPETSAEAPKQEAPKQEAQPAPEAPKAEQPAAPASESTEAPKS